jgi:WD40 repeat protein
VLWCAQVAHATPVGSTDGRISIWDEESSEPLQTLDGHAGVAYQAEWSKGQSLLASCGDDRLVRTWSFDPSKGFGEQAIGDSLSD